MTLSFPGISWYYIYINLLAYKTETAGQKCKWRKLISPQTQAEIGALSAYTVCMLRRIVGILRLQSVERLFQASTCANQQLQSLYS